MHLSTSVLAVLASWTALTAAAPPAPQPRRAERWLSNTPDGSVASAPSPSVPSAPWEGVKTRCYTRMDTTSGLWNTATSWSTQWHPCTVTLTSTATSTITPPPSTSTVTVTSTATTVGPTSFSTVNATTTTTSTVDTTTTTTLSTTTTTTSTVSTSTTTVAAPATFTPVQTSLPGSTYSGSGGPDPVSKREAKPERLHEQGSRPGLCNWRHPRGVVCLKWVLDKCSTTTTTTTSTVTATTHTVTTTSTSAVTTTSIPSGITTTTSTATGTTTSTITDTSTSTSTSTTTTYLATTTLYAACATNNLADEYLGSPFGEVTGGYSSVFDITTDDAYDCCVAAVTMTDTSVWAFEPNPFASEGANCFIGQTDGTCPAPGTNPSTAESGFGDLTIGNSYCGSITADVPIVSSTP